MSKGPNFILDKRQAARYAIDEQGILYNARFYRLPITLANISTSGIQVVDEELEVDDYVLIEWQDRKFEGTVRWSQDMVSGIEFHNKVAMSHPLMSAAMQKQGGA